MPVGERGDLGQVGDHDDLAVPGQLREPAADLHRDPPADPGIDLVEDQRLGRLTRRQHDLQREPDPGQLATRGDLGQALRVAAGIGAEQQLHLVGPVRAQLARPDVEDQPGVRQGQRGEFGMHPLGKGRQRPYAGPR